MTRKTIFDIYNEQHQEDVKTPIEHNEVLTTPTEEVKTQETNETKTIEETNENKSKEETKTTPLDDKGTTSLQEGENKNGNGNISAQSISA